MKIRDRDDSASEWKENLGSKFSLSLDYSDKQERYRVSFWTQSHTPLMEKSQVPPKSPANNPTGFAVTSNK